MQVASEKFPYTNFFDPRFQRVEPREQPGVPLVPVDHVHEDPDSLEDVPLRRRARSRGRERQPRFGVKGEDVVVGLDVDGAGARGAEGDVAVAPGVQDEVAILEQNPGSSGTKKVGESVCFPGRNLEEGSIVLLTAPRRYLLARSHRKAGQRTPTAVVKALLENS